MPRGRKKRVVLCQPPPKGHYMVDWTVNELIRRSALSGPAVSLWLHLKGLAWARGECEPTDAMLAEWLGGVSTEMVRITRRELRARHLLLEYAKAPTAGRAATRWLVPLPVLAGLRDNLPAEIAAAAAAEEARLRASLGEPEASSHPGSNGNSPQAEFGANAICPNVALVKEEEGRYPGDLYLAPPPERITAIARGNGEGGMGGGRIQPKPDLGLMELGASPNGGEDTQADAERVELTEFLVEHGAFASVAGNLVAWMLAHKTVEEAKVYALAHLRAVQEGEDPRGKRLQGEQVIARWVARLREHARPPEWALARAARELADADGADEEYLDEDDPDADPDADLPADEDDEPVNEDVEPAPPLPTVVCGAGDHACEVTVAELWLRTVGQLRYQLPGSTWETWLRNTRGVDLAGEDLVVEVGNRYAEEWLRIRLRPLIMRTLRAIAGRELGVAFRVAEGAEA